MAVGTLKKILIKLKNKMTLKALPDGNIMLRLLRSDGFGLPHRDVLGNVGDEGFHLPYPDVLGHLGGEGFRLPHHDILGLLGGEGFRLPHLDVLGLLGDDGFRLLGGTWPRSL